MSQNKKKFRSRLSTTRSLLFLNFFLVLPSCAYNTNSPPENFPGNIALAAYGKKDEPISSNKDQTCEFKITDLKEPSATDKSLINTAVEKAKGEGPYTKEHADKAIELIESGQFYTDIKSAVKVSTGTIPKIAKSIDLSVIQPSTVTCFFKDQFDCVYDNPTAEVTKDTAKILLKNESARLAIIVYARANGVNLEDQDLNALITVLETPDPDLHFLLKHGVNRFKKEYGGDKAEKILQVMKNGKVACKYVKET